MLITQDSILAEKARSLRAHGWGPKYYHKYIGGNFRLDPLQAAFLKVKLPYYPKYTESRQDNAAYYTERLSQIEHVGFEESEGTKIILPRALDGNEHIWNQYTVRVLGEGKRDALKQHFQERDIGFEIYYPVTMDQQECFSYIKTDSQTVEVSHRLAQECISIPIYAELTREMQDDVVGVIEKFLEDTKS